MEGKNRFEKAIKEENNYTIVTYNSTTFFDI